MKKLIILNTMSGQINLLDETIYDKECINHINDLATKLFETILKKNKKDQNDFLVLSELYRQKIPFEKTPDKIQEKRYRLFSVGMDLYKEILKTYKGDTRKVENKFKVSHPFEVALLQEEVIQKYKKGETNPQNLEKENFELFESVKNKTFERFVSSILHDYIEDDLREKFNGDTKKINIHLLNLLKESGVPISMHDEILSALWFLTNIKDREKDGIEEYETYCQGMVDGFEIGYTGADIALYVKRTADTIKNAQTNLGKTGESLKKEIEKTRIKVALILTFDLEEFLPEKEMDLLKQNKIFMEEYLLQKSLAPKNF